MAINEPIMTDSGLIQLRLDRVPSPVVLVLLVPKLTRKIFSEPFSVEEHRHSEPPRLEAVVSSSIRSIWVEVDIRFSKLKTCAVVISIINSSNGPITRPIEVLRQTLTASVILCAS